MRIGLIPLLEFDSNVLQMPKTPNHSSTKQSATKADIRTQALKNRRALANKQEISETIIDRLVESDDYERADTILFYVDVRSEVRTRHHLPLSLDSDKRVVIPYCVDGELQLFHLEGMPELEIGTYGILEPRQDLRSIAVKQVAVAELDLIVVPGVAFDPHGGRLGHGKGYYDKLLQHARRTTAFVGLAFDCQIVPRLPMLDHDVVMDRVITESTTYTGIRRAVTL